ncbi:MAG: 3-deoxy-7-phosphoheptulonate synthase [Dehalococcoidia bacterium]|nr:3-deoxy-7-phosphoheptulonate synthase [Dehalococcoidia bacterium]MDD5493219.1 3-deoxy-7-phosphoheptulonate synthase [Dehalococcoidia bacterium]
MMIMKIDSTEEQVSRVIKEIAKYGLRADVSRGEFRTVIGIVGDERKVPFDHFAVMPGVKEILKIDTPYKLISKEYGRVAEGAGGLRTGIQIGDRTLGNGEPLYIAGPCAVENKKQLFRIAEEIKKAGAHVLRGGIFKPRSSVHSFQGLGGINRKSAETALRWLSEAGREFGLPVVTEVRGEEHVDLAAEYADILQIGARNMYNQDLLAKVGRKNRPILLKRHFGAGIEEFLSFAEYIAAEGNKNIILCERGIVPIGKGKEYTRYTLDLAAVPAIQKETYLPIIVDPSHGTGRRDLVYNMSCAAMAAGANGLMVEVHYNPEEAIVDGRQTITPAELSELIKACDEISRMVKSRAEIAGQGSTK